MRDIECGTSYLGLTVKLIPSTPESNDVTLTQTYLRVGLVVAASVQSRTCRCCLRSTPW